MTALHYATSCEDEELAQLLVCAGPGVLLHVTHSVCYKRLTVWVDDQVNHGASVDIQDNDGESPLSYASTDELSAILIAASRSQAE